IRKRRDATVRLYASQFDEKMDYTLDERPTVKAGSWSSYVTGAIEEVRREAAVSGGFEMAIDGNVPLGSGLSSSAALEVSVVMALGELFGLQPDPLDTIRLCRRVEHRYAGVECGIMDQFVSRLGKANSALLLDCRSLDYEYVPIDLASSGLSLVIANTRIHRELAGSKYGERRAECRRAESAIQLVFPDVSSLRDVQPPMLERLRDALPATMYDRARHVVEENERVLAAAESLRGRNHERFGRLMQASHSSLRDLFEVSCDELDTLVEAAGKIPGVLGARMTGGGFGGCTITLVRTESVADLNQHLTGVYESVYGYRPDVFVLERNVQAGRL
ncbi:MAG: galactokinase, partial [Rhodothermales bacterium]